MTEEEELREEMKSLRKQVDMLEDMMETLMDTHKRVLENVTTSTDVEERYMKMLSVYNRFGSISPGLLPGVDDHISEKIVEILLGSDQLNISQITGRLREKKGSASRHTVRQRLKDLEERGVVKKTDTGKGKNYELTDKTIDEWAGLLGINK